MIGFLRWSRHPFRRLANHSAIGFDPHPNIGREWDRFDCIESPSTMATLAQRVLVSALRGWGGFITGRLFS
jgi:hypothetical protein